MTAPINCYINIIAGETAPDQRLDYFLFAEVTAPINCFIIYSRRDCAGATIVVAATEHTEDCLVSKGNSKTFIYLTEVFVLLFVCTYTGIPIRYFTYVNLFFSF
jgi:hypothetical protein